MTQPDTLPGVSPWRRAAGAYWAAGLNPLPLQSRERPDLPSKTSPPAGYTGGGARVLDWPAYERWTTTEFDGPAVNICVRSVGSWLGIDVDCWEGKQGAATLAALEAQYGTLPATWSSTSRDDGSRIMFFRVPRGEDTSGWRDPGHGIEVIRKEHRYALVWPSVHDKTGRTYRWRTPDGAVALDTVPSITDFAELPAGWLEYFRGRATADRVDLPAVDVCSPDRAFTLAEATAFVAPLVAALKSAPAGEINTRLNDAAMAFGHFTAGGFWPEEHVTRGLLQAQRDAWVAAGGADDGDYSSATGTIRSGLQAGAQRPYTLVETTPELAEVMAHPESATSDALALAVERERTRREARRVVDAEEQGRSADQSAVDALRGELLRSSELDSIEDLVPLVEGWLYQDSLARIVGKSGSFKTFVALDVALSVASKRPWFGYDVNGGPVLYVVAEGARGIRKRIRAWELSRNLGAPVDDLYVLPRAVQMLESEYLALVGLARSVGAVLVVLDTQARVTVGVDENSATDMGRVVAMADRLRAETGACVALVHHLGLTGGHARGSSAVYGALQTEVDVTRGAEEAMHVDLRTTKQKDHDEQSGRFKMVPAGDSLVLSNLDASDERQADDDRIKIELKATLDESMGVREQVARVLHDYADGTESGITKAELVAAVNDARRRAKLQPFVRSPKPGQSKAVQYLHRILVELERDGHIEKPATARYRLSPEGCSDHGLRYTESDENRFTEV